MEIKKFSNERIKRDIIFMKAKKTLSEIVSHFNCMRCGQCCCESNPALLYPEIKHFKYKTELVWEEENQVYRLKSPCVFYYHDKDNHMAICKTENYKPMSCKIYPFSFGHKELGYLSIVLCPLGAEIFSKWSEFCEFEGKIVRIDRVKLLGEEDKTKKAKDIFDKEFSGGGKFSITDLIWKINNASSENDEVGVKPAFSMGSREEMEEFAEYLRKGMIKNGRRH